MKPDPPPARKLTTQPHVLRSKRIGEVVAVRFGREENGEDYGVIVEAAAVVNMSASEFVREFALFQAHKILRGKRRRAG